jgi:hypothetical protein
MARDCTVRFGRVCRVRFFGQDDERLPLLDDIRRKFGRIPAADVFHRVNHFGRDEENLASLDRRRRLALDPILQRPSEDSSHRSR